MPLIRVCVLLPSFVLLVGYAVPSCSEKLFGTPSLGLEEIFFWVPQRNAKNVRGNGLPDTYLH